MAFFKGGGEGVFYTTTKIYCTSVCAVIIVGTILRCWSYGGSTISGVGEANSGDMLTYSRGNLVDWSFLPGYGEGGFVTIN